MYDDDYGGYDDFNEFNDWDATDCANGDYNTWEEEQVFQDGVAERAALAREALRESIAREIAREVVGDPNFDGTPNAGDYRAADRILGMVEGEF